MDLEHANPELVIRSLTFDDCPRLVAIDKQKTGRRRTAWYEGKLKRALDESDLHISLGADKDGLLVGAMLASLFYGEFGQPEPVAVLDTVMVDTEFSRQGIASALLEQLTANLRGLRIERIRTEVDWNDHEMIAYFGASGFTPVPRLVLEARLGEP